MSHELLKKLIRQYITESIKELLSVDLTVRLKVDDNTRDLKKGEAFTVENVGKDSVTLKQVFPQQQCKLDNYRSSTFVISYDEFEKLFEL